MFKQLLYLVLTLSLVSCVGKTTRNDEKVITMNSDFTIAFYNVENLFDTKDDPGVRDEDFTPEGEKQWTEERYQKKLNHISRVFQAIDEELPIIIGLCEVENRGVLEDLIEQSELLSANFGIVHYNSSDLRGIDVALLYQKDYFQILEEKSIPVEFDHRPEVLTRDILYVKGNLNNEILHVYVNHWSSKGKGEKETEWKRIETAKILRNHVDRILAEDPKAKIVIMGDFNDEPHHKSMKKYLGAEDPSRSSVLYNTSFNLSRKGVGSHFFNEWNMLDQIVVTKELYLSKSGIQLSDKNQQLLQEDWLYYERGGDKFPNKTYSGDTYHGGYSDHLPIYIKLKSN